MPELHGPWHRLAFLFQPCLSVFSACLRPVLGTAPLILQILPFPSAVRSVVRWHACSGKTQLDHMQGSAYIILRASGAPSKQGFSSLRSFPVGWFGGTPEVRFQLDERAPTKANVTSLHKPWRSTKPHYEVLGSCMLKYWWCGVMSCKMRSTATGGCVRPYAFSFTWHSLVYTHPHARTGRHILVAAAS